MNFAFQNAYTSYIEPMIYGVPWTLEQRVKAMDAIRETAEKNCASCEFLSSIRFCKRFVSYPSKHPTDAYIKIYDREYRDLSDFANICQNIIMLTEQKRRTEQP